MAENKIEIAIMIEGQNGLNWKRWQKIASIVEGLGFAGLYRSDHFTNAKPPDMDSLELWVSLTWLASHTRRIEFGSLVSPVSFRHPAMTARMASAVDDLSDGRLRLGLGAGWQDREHYKFSFDLLALPQRFARFEEGLRIITHLLQKPEPLTFKGKYYQINDAMILPPPARPGGPPIVIGGNGIHYTLPLVARFANEWNALFIPPQQFKDLNVQLDKLILKNGRKPEDVRRTLMTNITLGRNELDLETKLRGRALVDMRAKGYVAGTPSMIVDQIAELEEAGLQRVMLQWLDLDDLQGLEVLAQTLL